MQLAHESDARPRDTGGIGSVGAVVLPRNRWPPCAFGLIRLLRRDSTDSSAQGEEAMSGHDRAFAPARKACRGCA